MLRLSTKKSSFLSLGYGYEGGNEVGFGLTNNCLIPYYYFVWCKALIEFPLWRLLSSNDWCFLQSMGRKHWKTWRMYLFLKSPSAHSRCHNGGCYQCSETVVHTPRPPSLIGKQVCVHCCGVSWTLSTVSSPVRTKLSKVFSRGVIKAFVCP